MPTQDDKKAADAKQAELEFEARRLAQLRIKTALTEASAVNTVVEADEDVVDAILKAYNDQYSQAGKDGKGRAYNEGYNAPERRPDGTLVLRFPTKAAADKFFTQQAEKGHKFIVVNEQKEVLAYSDGKGKLIQNDAEPKKNLEAVQKELMPDSSPSSSPSPSPK